MHNITAEIKAIIAIPILHIADATGQLLLRDKVTKVGLLGTSFTMQQDFHKGRLTDNFGTQVLVPNSRDQNVVNDSLTRSSTVRCARGLSGLNPRCSL